MSAPINTGFRKDFPCGGFWFFGLEPSGCLLFKRAALKRGSGFITRASAHRARRWHRRIFMFVAHNPAKSLSVAGARIFNAPKSSDRFAKGAEARPNLFCEKLRLLPRREVVPFVELVVVDELGIAACNSSDVFV